VSAWLSGVVGWAGGAVAPDQMPSAGEVASDLSQLSVGRSVPGPTEGAAGGANRSRPPGDATDLICPVKINIPGIPRRVGRLDNNRSEEHSPNYVRSP
jgi:hypothetical protein